MAKRISLVLGSGGARGYAHIGVIEALEERGYEIVAISGASMGALIGGLYAAGGLQEYKEWVLSLDALDVATLLDFSWDRRGMVSGRKVLAKLGDIIGDRTIESLPLDYTAVATDLRDRREVWFQEGSLLEAIRASISIPTFFTPVEKEGRLLVDGGVLNPLPVAPTMASRGDMIVAVSLFGEGELPRIAPPKEVKEKESRLQTIVEEIVARARALKEERESRETYHLFDIFNMTLDAMQKRLVGYRLGGYPPDWMIEIPQDVCGTLDFHRAWEVIETGRILADESLDRLEKRKGTPR